MKSSSLPSMLHGMIDQILLFRDVPGPLRDSAPLPLLL